MEAVKRAYAEIILNTAAESAARVLASERKALGFQQSLAEAKQEAVGMMIRLKSLMDSKIQEAETRNTLHARRIQELESQLQEAQGTILSLTNELERERNNNNIKCTHAVPTEEKDDNCFMDSRNYDSSCSARNGTSSGTGTGSAQDLREKKVRIRNGCTQRIVALDQSKEPKGVQIFGNKKGSTKQEPEGENGGDSKLLLRRGPPRKSRSKFNYVKMSKFGMNINKDEASGEKAIKGLLKCTENDKSEGNNNCHEKEYGKDSDFEEALFGLELITDQIGKEDKLVSATQKATQDLTTENPELQENISTVTKPGSEELETPVVNLKPQIEETPLPITGQEGLRSIKYTFMRKRKRGSLENNNNNTENKEEEENKERWENGNSSDGNKKKKKYVKRNKELKSVGKRSLRLKDKNEKMLLDSPRSNRRMVQVARQLVSLSAREW